MYKKAKICLLCMTLCAQGFFLALPAYSQSVQHSSSTWISAVREAKETEKNLMIAAQFKEQHRYELARQYLLLALATCRTNDVRVYIHRELKNINLQIKTLR